MAAYSQKFLKYAFSFIFVEKIQDNYFQEWFLNQKFLDFGTAIFYDFD
jgi:hypothetical protein